MYTPSDLPCLLLTLEESIYISVVYLFMVFIYYMFILLWHGQSPELVTIFATVCKSIALTFCDSKYSATCRDLHNIVDEADNETSVAV